MPIKDLKDLIREGVIPGRTTAPKPKVDPKYTTMSEVVPPLSRGGLLELLERRPSSIRKGAEGKRRRRKGNKKTKGNNKHNLV